MKSMKKLIPAMAMLIVSAVVMSTASFAWFSMNTKVSATNMQVQATASKNLLISKTGATAADYTSTVDMAINKTALAPVSTIGGDTATPKFYKIQNVGTAMNPNDYALGDDSTLVAATANADYVMSSVWLKCVGENATSLKANITAAGDSAKLLDPALRVMLVVKSATKTYIYSPITGASYGTSGKAVSAVEETTNKAVLGDIKTAATSEKVILDTLTKDTSYQVDIYIWYEGEDVNCKATNTLDMAETTFAIDFTVS